MPSTVRELPIVCVVDSGCRRKSGKKVSRATMPRQTREHEFQALLVEFLCSEQMPQEQLERLVKSARDTELVETAHSDYLMWGDADQSVQMFLLDMFDEEVRESNPIAQMPYREWDGIWREQLPKAILRYREDVWINSRPTPIRLVTDFLAAAYLSQLFTDEEVEQIAKSLETL